jgi:tripartite ATP-independent transporter DctM subunit
MVSLKVKIVSLKMIILPILLVVAILGSIFSGIATPTEAASVGALGSVAIAAVNRKLNWSMIKNASIKTFLIVCTLMWIVFGANVFTLVYDALGASKLIAQIITGIEANRWIILAIMQLTWFLLGFVIVNVAILMLTLPIFLPIVTALGFDTLWFGLLFVINMEMALLTPPFGITLFYMKAVAPEGTKMSDIYRSIIPFVILQGIGLVLVMVFPNLALWLPRLVFGRTG